MKSVPDDYEDEVVVCDGECTHVVRSRVAHMRYPRTRAEYDGGFAVLEMTCGVTVLVQAERGNERSRLPLVDEYHHYTLMCKENRSRYGRRYRLVERLAVRPLPFTRALVVRMLQCECAMKRANAEALVRLEMPPDAKVEQLVYKDWFRDIYTQCVYFRGERLQRLARFWPLRRLKNLSDQVCKDLEEMLDCNPFLLCFSWHVPCAGLRELRRDELTALCPERYAAPRGDAKLELDTLDAYASLKAKHHDRQDVYASTQTPSIRLRSFFDNRALQQFAHENDLLHVVEREGARYIVSHGDLQLECRLERALTDVFNRPRAAQEREDIGSFEHALVDVLADEQQVAVDRALSTRFCIVSGPPGSGKTAVAAHVMAHYEDGEVLPVAAFGLTAEMLERRLGAGYTIDRVIAACRRAQGKGNAVGLYQRRVLLIDEFSTVTTRHLVSLLEALDENGAQVEQIVCMGDLDQKEPIERGALMDQCWRRYSKHCVSLTLNHRVADEAKLIARNVARIRRGDLRELEYSRDLASNDAFVLVDRTVIERDVGRLREHCDGALIVTQRNSDRQAINRAYRTQESGVEYKENVLHSGERVMFMENYYSKTNSKTPPHMIEDSVMNGMMGVLERFEDVTSDGIVQREASDAVKSEGAHRFVVVRRDAQELRVSLENYPLRSIQRAYATTISKVQGCEFPVVIFYVQAGEKRYMMRSDVLVACSRASHRVIVVCAQGELEALVAKRRVPPCDFLWHRLPEMQ